MEPMTDHGQEAYSRLSSIGQRFFKFIEFDENEELVGEIRKHPFGLLVIDLVGFAITALLAIIPIGLALNLDSFDLGGSSNSQSFSGLLIFVGMLLATLSIVATLISAMLYKNNVIYVTSDKIAQVLYTSLFNRKMSQLSIGDIQDVTVTQKGVFARIFNYGTLVIETAGEQQNYTFNYVPDPYQSARLIVGAHEENLKKFGN
jgi:uncharacterized membrane protein YdbT with pleckstrin-like domain